MSRIGAPGPITAALGEELQVHDRAGDRRPDVAAAQHVLGGAQLLLRLGELGLHFLELLRDLLPPAVFEIEDPQLGLADRLLGARDLGNVLAAPALERAAWRRSARSRALRSSPLPNSESTSAVSSAISASCRSSEPTCASRPAICERSCSIRCLRISIWP